MIMMLQSTPPKRVAQQTNKPHGAGNGGRRADIKKWKNPHYLRLHVAIMWTVRFIM
ncbi:hypothetical protein CCACVL1_28396 [Corchorus capsularis]|uniref:Uncharacterized protein n=1 Tax=Corchorus capsularis TaxID=210143 RepID=A0A1R3G6M8_COCAP|nr:hypothetical protein CCACVL1_28396 [Corchorus capsularis]